MTYKYALHRLSELQAIAAAALEESAELTDRMADQDGRFANLRSATLGAQESLIRAGEWLADAETAVATGGAA